MRFVFLICVFAVSSCGLTNTVTDGLFGSGTPADPLQAEGTITDVSLSAGTDELDDSETISDPVQDAALVSASGPMSTVAALGDPTKPGLWLETPLVSGEQPGHVSYGSAGKRIQITLIPIEGEATAGSRLSLEGYQALGAPLTELVELTVQPL